VNNLTLFGLYIPVNAPDSDIYLRSADGVQFHVHRKNLEVHSPVFATAGVISAPLERQEVEVVQLSEPAEVLNLLLQFMYSQPQPDLIDLPFPVLADLMKAVEKYEVYSAMIVCSFAMKLAVCSPLIYVSFHLMDP
jgi:hypothetical protein